MTARERLNAAYDAADDAFEADIDAAYTNATRFNAAYAAVDTAWATYSAACKAARIAYKTELENKG
ncbi:MAG: hypothetical protein P8P29_00385 [Flavobacteriaceae bacterium]|nr:hypothetical protein [Flavobacteriaceae bacterium]